PRLGGRMRRALHTRAGRRLSQSERRMDLVRVAPGRTVRDDSPAARLLHPAGVPAGEPWDGGGGEFLVSGGSLVLDLAGNQQAILLDLTVVTPRDGWESSGGSR